MTIPVSTCCGIRIRYTEVGRDDHANLLKYVKRKFRDRRPQRDDLVVHLSVLATGHRRGGIDLVASCSAPQTASAKLLCPTAVWPQSDRFS